MKRLVLAVSFAAVLLFGHVSAQTFSQPLNVAMSTLAATHAPAAAGQGTLLLQPGTGQYFGTPTPTSPVRVMAIRMTTLASNGAVVPTTTRTIFLVTARSGDTLSGLTVAADEGAGNADQTFVRNDFVISPTVTAGMLREITDLLGATVSARHSATSTLDFPSTPPQTSRDLTMTVTGAVVGDSVAVGPGSAPAPNTSFTGWVSATNVVTVRHNNYSAATVDPVSATFRATVTH